MILICKGADFSANKIGTVSVKAVASIAINGASSVEGTSTQLTATATYSDTSTGTVQPQWSITSGASYASVNSSGVLTVLTGASSNTVVVAADYDGKVATKTITVTYRYSETYSVNVANFTSNNGTAGTIQNDYGNVSASNAAYTMIIPAGSGNKLNILYSAITVNGTEYSPKFRIVGMNANAYGTADGTTNNAARINKYSSDSQQYADGKRYNGQIHGGWSVPTLPLTIPYQYESTLTTKNTNVPYMAISVLFQDSSNNNLANIAQYASQISLTYTVTDASQSS